VIFSVLKCKVNTAFITLGIVLAVFTMLFMIVIDKIGLIKY